MRERIWTSFRPFCQQNGVPPSFKRDKKIQNPFQKRVKKMWKNIGYDIWIEYLKTVPTVYLCSTAKFWITFLSRFFIFENKFSIRKFQRYNLHKKAQKVQYCIWDFFELAWDSNPDRWHGNPRRYPLHHEADDKQ